MSEKIKRTRRRCADCDQYQPHKHPDGHGYCLVEQQPKRGNVDGCIVEDYRKEAKHE